MLRRTVAVAASVIAVASGTTAPGSAATSAPHDLYVYGHSWTTGYGLTDPSKSYPHLVAADQGETLVNRGVNGPMVHQIADYLIGRSAGTWRAGTTGDVLLQTVSNTARDLGVDPLAMTTTRNALRAMVATVSASRRLEDADRSHRYHGTWRTHVSSHDSGGAMHVTSRNRAYVEFRAAGGEYLLLRGVSGAGVTARLGDRTTGRTVTRIRTGHRVHPTYARYGIPLVYRVPQRLAGHTLRLTKESGTGSLMFDARLPQQAHPSTVVLLEEPYLLDYSVSTAHPNGSDHVMDVFNDLTARVAEEFPQAVVVDPNGQGWDVHTMLGGTHPNVDGSRFLADLIDSALLAAHSS